MTTKIRATHLSQTLRSGVQQASRAQALADATPEMIITRLEEAGATLLALPRSGYSTKMRQMRFDIVHTALEAYGWEKMAVRPASPSADAISAMDEAFGWLGLIPEDAYMLRRILGARALVHPITQRYLYPWRRLATTLGVDHKSVQRWHRQGVVLLVNILKVKD